MDQGNVGASRIILLGLSEDLADSSRKVLAEQGHQIFSYPFLSADNALSLILRLRADCVFCVAEPEKYTLLIAAIQQKMADLPLVVVGRLPETSAWLAALQAGAADYCVPPFEAASIRWVLESALQSRRAA